MPKTNRSERVPRAVEPRGYRQPGCRRCHGDGVVVLVSLSGPAFRPCACVANTRRPRLLGRSLWESQVFQPERHLPNGLEL
jgi:hypothetical protein